jgi:hypothetical protein
MVDREPVGPFVGGEQRHQPQSGAGSPLRDGRQSLRLHLDPELAAPLLNALEAQGRPQGVAPLAHRPVSTTSTAARSSSSSHGGR